MKQDKKTEVITVNYKGKGHNVKIKRFIPLQESISMKENIVDLSFLEVSDTLVYFPYIEDYAKKLHFLAHYTNIKIPVDPEASWKLICADNIADQVFRHYDKDFLDNAFAGVDKMIEFKKEQLLRNERVRNIGEMISSTIESIGKLIPDVDYKKVLETMKEEYPEFTKEIEQAAAEEEAL